MESSNELHESFRQGFTTGYVFTATFFIVFYLSYCLPTQLVKKRRSKTGGYTKARQTATSKLERKITRDTHAQKRKKARRTQLEKELPVELLKTRIQVSEIGWLNRRISFTELSDATKYFSADSAIRDGITGRMFRATLPNGWFLAVKRLYDSHLFIPRFEVETMILGRYSHRNIVPLVGYCIEEERNERILVYEYMSNGSLSDWLSCDVTRIGWNEVIRIALGVARGLCCLHHSLHMVHLNISPKYILLENNFEPKISNFGGAIFVDHNVGKNKGFEKDVYDFGIMLLEVIRGKVFGQTQDWFSNTKGPFATYAYPTNLLEDPFGFHDAMDTCLSDIEYEDEVSALLGVACDCVHPSPCQRPTMLKVYTKMSNLWERDEIF